MYSTLYIPIYPILLCASRTNVAAEGKHFLIETKDPDSGLHGNLVSENGKEIDYEAVTFLV